MDKRPEARVPDTRHYDVGSDRGGERAAIMYSLIVTAKLNDVDPQAWLADVLDRIAGHPASKLDELMPWNWKVASAKLAA
ncbi:IS66 C-terminal element [Rhizobiales bacterium GAS191]|nr:IS66 C-terminal element [Rhizobiales bacterium GAS191]